MCRHGNPAIEQSENCGFCIDCCPDRKSILDQLPAADRPNRMPLIMVPKEK
jgi:hypothetical protein